jgi:hypothetical protein
VRVTFLEAAVVNFAVHGVCFFDDAEAGNAVPRAH